MSKKKEEKKKKNSTGAKKSLQDMIYGGIFFAYIESYAKWICVSGDMPMKVIKLYVFLQY